MDKFSELISKGVAPARYKSINHDTSCSCPICRSYNNTFSIATGTHISHTEDDNYIITGSIIKDHKKWDTFLFSSQYHEVDFNHTNFRNFSDWMCSNRLVGEYSVINGEEVYILRDMDDVLIKASAEVRESVIQFDQFITSQNSIPQSTRFITKDPYNFTKCMTTNIFESAKNLNDSHYVPGNSWSVLGFSDGLHIVGDVNGLKIKLI